MGGNKHGHTQRRHFRKSRREQEENVWKKHEDFREDVIMLNGLEEPTSIVKNESLT
jgi:hypothetical protein